MYLSILQLNTHLVQVRKNIPVIALSITRCQCIPHLRLILPMGKVRKLPCGLYSCVFKNDKYKN